MAKRGAEYQINHLGTEPEQEEDEASVPKTADRAVMAGRKIAKPRARRLGPSASTLPLPSPMSSFGSSANTSAPSANPFAKSSFASSSTTPSTTENKSVNPIAGNLFSSSSNTNENKSVNPFAGVALSSDSNVTEKLPVNPFAAGATASTSSNGSTGASGSSAFKFKPAETSAPPASSFNFKPPQQAPTPPQSSFGFKSTESASTPSSSFNFNPAGSTISSGSFSKPLDASSTSSFGASKPNTGNATKTFQFKNAAASASLFGTNAPKSDTSVKAGSSDNQIQLKISALNKKVSAHIQSQLEKSPYSDLSIVMKSYIDFAKTIQSEANSTQSQSTAIAPASATASVESQSSDEEGHEKPVEVKGPQFKLAALPKSKSKGPFLFGKEAEARAKREAAEDSDSEDEIEVKGPQFTLSAIPTTTKSAFSFQTNQSEKVKQEGTTIDTKKDDDKPAAPVFTFGQAAPTSSAVPSTPFKFGSSNSVLTDTNNHTWTPDKGIKFGNAAPASNGEAKPFSFSSNSQEPAGEKKPAFSFGAAASTSSESKPPAFTFGSGTTSSTGALFGSKTESKPSNPFSFNVASQADKKPEAAAPAPGGSNFSFGGNAAAPSGPSLFGAPASGAPAGTGLFGAKSFATTSTPAVASSTPSAVESTDEEHSNEPQSTDLSVQGPGEENEEPMYEKKAKVYEVKDGAPESLGVGILRVLTHKDTKKTRVLVRADGSGRVIINVLLRQQLTYTATGTQVKIIDFKSDGSPTTYVVRVKTADDGSKLSAIMEKHKN